MEWSTYCERRELGRSRAHTFNFSWLCTYYGTWRLLLPSQVESPLCGGEGTWWRAELQREGKTDKSGSAMGSLSFSWSHYHFKMSSHICFLLRFTGTALSHDKNALLLWMASTKRGWMGWDAKMDGGCSAFAMRSDRSASRVGAKERVMHYSAAPFEPTPLCPSPLRISLPCPLVPFEHLILAIYHYIYHLPFLASFWNAGSHPHPYKWVVRQF